MYSYFQGTVISINKKSITFDCNNIGYIVNVSNPEYFTPKEKAHLYVYAQYTNNNKNGFLEDIYGFKEYKQKELFLALMQCQGIGPKTAMIICRNNYDVLTNLIANKDIEGLKKCYGINEKNVHNIIERLANHFAFAKDNPEQNNIISELFDALVSLGYKENDIQYAVNEISKTNPDTTELSDLIAEAIKLIVNKNQIVEPNGIN